MFLWLWDHRCSAGGWGFWHLGVISLLELLMFHNLKNPKGLWDAVQTFRGEHLGSRMLLPSMTNNNPSAAQREASRAPWSLLHLLLLTARLCSPCSISSDTTSIPPSPGEKGRGGVWSRTSQSGAVCVWVCRFFYFFSRIAVASAERSTYETTQPSMKSSLFSFKGLTWVFNDQFLSLYINSTVPFFLMHI